MTPDNRPTTDLQSLCRLSGAELQEFLRRVTLLYRALHEDAPGVEVETAGAPESPLGKGAPFLGEESLGALEPRGRIPELPSEAAAAIRRTSMRPPAPGSVRAAVYDVLQTEGRAMGTGEVAAAVAASRGETVTDNLKASVGEVLRNRHDPCIRRVTARTYALVP